MHELWKWANLSLALAVEMAALVALGWWGWQVSDAFAPRIVAAIGIPLAAAVIWGSFAAPKAAFDIPLLAIATKVVVFGAATAALWDLGFGAAAMIFLIVVVANLSVIELGHLAA